MFKESYNVSIYLQLIPELVAHSITYKYDIVPSLWLIFIHNRSSGKIRRLEHRSQNCERLNKSFNTIRDIHYFEERKKRLYYLYFFHPVLFIYLFIFPISLNFIIKNLLKYFL